MLKGSEIYIDEDFNSESRNTRAMLFKEAKRQREAGNKAVLRFDKIVIKGETFVWNVDQQELEPMRRKEAINEFRHGEEAGQVEMNMPKKRVARVEGAVFEDTTLNTEGMKLLDFCDLNALKIMNGCSAGDREGRFTFIGSLGASVIDYALIKEENPELTLEVVPRTESEHLPLCIKLDWEPNRIETMKAVERTRWSLDESAKILYKTTLDQELNKQDLSTNAGIELALQNLNACINCAAIDAKLRKTTGNQSREHWFDRDYKKEKCNVGRLLYKFRRSKNVGDRITYTMAKKNLRRLCQSKKKKGNKKFGIRLIPVRTQPSFVKKSISLSGRRLEKGQDIPLDEWKDYFMRVLNRRDARVSANPYVEADRIISKQHKFLNRDFEEGEFRKTISQLKKRKAAGPDGIINEFYQAMSGEAKTIALKIVNDIWHGEECPEEWRTGVIIPIFKSDKTRDVGNYRGITLLIVYTRSLQRLWRSGCKIGLKRRM
uniref:Endonuclease/exonuclease/phosphatase domain-containing protein n=1 Tax=Strigamia maritima TaxID=126957 RepID=T1IYS6_STRMM